MYHLDNANASLGRHPLACFCDTSSSFTAISPSSRDSACSLLAHNRLKNTSYEDISKSKLINKASSINAQSVLEILHTVSTLLHQTPFEWTHKHWWTLYYRQQIQLVDLIEPSRLQALLYLPTCTSDAKHLLAKQAVEAWIEHVVSWSLVQDCLRDLELLQHTAKILSLPFSLLATLAIPHLTSSLDSKKHYLAITLLPLAPDSQPPSSMNEISIFPDHFLILSHILAWSLSQLDTITTLSQHPLADKLANLPTTRPPWPSPYRLQHPSSSLSSPLVQQGFQTLIHLARSSQKQKIPIALWEIQAIRYRPLSSLPIQTPPTFIAAPPSLWDYALVWLFHAFSHHCSVPLTDTTKNAFLHVCLHMRFDTRWRGRIAAHHQALFEIYKKVTPQIQTFFHLQAFAIAIVDVAEDAATLERNFYLEGARACSHDATLSENLINVGFLEVYRQLWPARWPLLDRQALMLSFWIENSTCTIFDISFILEKLHLVCTLTLQQVQTLGLAFIKRLLQLPSNMDTYQNSLFIVDFFRKTADQPVPLPPLAQQLADVDPPVSYFISLFERRFFNYSDEEIPNYYLKYFSKIQQNNALLLTQIYKWSVKLSVKWIEQVHAKQQAYEMRKPSVFLLSQSIPWSSFCGDMRRLYTYIAHVLKSIDPSKAASLKRWHFYYTHPDALACRSHKLWRSHATSRLPRAE